jgi:5-methylcytosine-specific restriction endonuclease McrA
MIPVTREPTPAHLADGKNVAKWTNDLCERRRKYYRDLKAHRKPPTGIPKPTRPHANRDHYAHDDVIAVLEAMFGSKCAYCEGDVAATSPQHVEHYRPASRYPALAHAWDNLLFACWHCNVTFKSDRFPIEPAGNTPKENRTNPSARTGQGEVAPCSSTLVAMIPVSISRSVMAESSPCQDRAHVPER